MIKFHRNKFTGPLDLLPKKKKQQKTKKKKTISSSVFVDLYYIVNKSFIYDHWH